MAQGVDNFLYERTLDGSTVTFKFWDPDDPTNTETVTVSPKEFPGGATSPDTRDVQDYAYSLVADKLNDKRSERIRQAEVERVKDEQARGLAERAATVAHLKEAEANSTKPIGTEVREDGITQNVFSSTVDTAPSKDGKKK